MSRRQEGGLRPPGRVFQEEMQYQTGWPGHGGGGHDPFNPMLPDNLPNLGKIHFQDEKPGSPRLEMLYPVSFGTVSPSFWQIQGVFMKKTIIIFK